MDKECSSANPETQKDRPKSIRLFVAINLPDEITQAIAECQKELVSLLRDSSIRWTQAEQVHITLKFLGNVPADAREAIEKTLLKACEGVSSFELKAKGLGCFPNLRSPRVIWVGVTGDVAPLIELQQSLDSAFKSWAEPEGREFKPHLTLARVKEIHRRDGQAHREFIEKRGDCEFGSWNVRQIDLMQSNLGPEGATYSVLASARLG